MVVSIVIILFVVVVFAVIVRYIRMMRLSARVEESWGDVKLLLKHRAELIPAIADTVQQYARGEKEIFQRLVSAQRQAGRVVGVQARSAAEEQLQGALQELLHMVEAYPQLKTHDGLRQLRGELLGLEVRLRRSITTYNKAVAQFNRSRSLPRTERELFGMASSPLRLLQ